MKALDVPAKGERKVEHLNCKECGGDVRLTARVRTPEGYAVVVCYRCEECGAKARQKVKPAAEDEFAEVRREYERVYEERTPPGEEPFHRSGFRIR